MKFSLFFFTGVVVCLLSLMSVASDHDDGETERKGRSLNITDVYAFREDNQTGNPADAANLILVMNTNPRSLPGQQYFFSTQARYTFHLTRVLDADKNKKPTGADDILLTLSFSEPNATGQQAIRLVYDDGSATTATQTTSGSGIVTTNISDSKAERLANNVVSVRGKLLTVFAGLREDPFFFDVEQFFKVRAKAVETFVANGGRNPQFIGFLPPNQAKDFTHNYNVNSIVVRVPFALLQQNSNQTSFDVWTTISVPR